MIKQITCDEFDSNLETYLRGLLDPIQERRFDQHEKTCHSECHQKYVSTRFAEWIAEEGFGLFINGGREDNLKHCLNSSTRTEYAKDEMTAEEREMVRDHIKNCSYCRGLVHAEIRFWEGEKFHRKSKEQKERISIIERVRKLIGQLKEKSIKIIYHLIWKVFNYKRKGISLYGLFGDPPRFTSSRYDPAGIIESVLETVEVSWLPCLGYLPEVEILLLKRDIAEKGLDWIIEFYFTPLSSTPPTPFSVILQGKGICATVDVKPNIQIANSEIPPQISPIALKSTLQERRIRGLSEKVVANSNIRTARFKIPQRVPLKSIWINISTVHLLFDALFANKMFKSCHTKSCQVKTHKIKA